MSSSIEPQRGPIRTYDRLNSIVFLKTGEPFGGLSNMAGGYPLLVQGVRILSSEALYQACRFPHLPEVQRSIIAQASPITAKMISKPYRKDSRPDWEKVRVKVMRWCIRVKLTQHWAKFGTLLLQTADCPIVEESRRDAFWGAKRVGDQTLVGMNVLGRLLMELREIVRSANTPILHVEPLDIPSFFLLGQQIEAIDSHYLPARHSTAGWNRDEKPFLPKEQKPLFQEISTSEALSTESELVSASDTPSIEFNPYPVMKDSGVPWLDQVPAHWSVMPGLAVYKPRLLRNAGMRESTVLSLSYGRIIVKPLEKLRGLVPESFETYQIVEPGNIIVRTTDLQNDQTSLRIGLAEDHGIITSAYMCLETTSLVSPQFGYQYLNASDLLKVLYGLGSGLRQNLDFTDIKRMPVLVPPPAEQAVIARFLSYVDRQIQRYVHSKKKLIKLLEEQKQAIINLAVTRGLNDNIRFKPSGLEWLGDVPEHWQVVPSKRTFTPRTELARTDDVQLSATQAYGVIPQDEYERRVGRRIVKILRHLDKRRHVEMDDLVISMRSFQGGLERAWAAGCIRSSYIVLRPTTRLDVSYFSYLFKAASYIKALQSTADFIRDGQDLNYDNFCAIDLPFPPLEEQSQIAAFLKKITGEIGKAAETTQVQIDLVKEYRTRLIADVVTGKLDVREAEARLPPETEALEPLGEIDIIDRKEEIEDLEAEVEEVQA